jgi:hypothetical protein
MADLKVAAEFLKSCLQAYAPYDTGNLALNSIRILYDTNGDVFVAIGGEIAPYAVYTNEKWVSDKWNGKSNPNENWIENAIDEALPLIKDYLLREMSQKDFDQYLEYYKRTFKHHQEERMRNL